MIQPPKEKKVQKERKYKKEAQIDPQKEYQKVINIKGNVFVFNMRGRVILNEREFNRFVTYMDSYIRPFAASNFKKILNGEFDELYNEFVYRLWRCIATFDNEDTSRVEERASFPTYFMSILRKDLENKRVTRDKSRTIDRLKQKGKNLEAAIIQGLVHAIPMSTLEPWQVDLLGVTEIEERINDEDNTYELVEVTTTTTFKIKGIEDDLNINAESESELEQEQEQEPELELESETKLESEPEVLKKEV